MDEYYSTPHFFNNAKCNEMTNYELKFCEQFERKAKSLELLKTVKQSLTVKGTKLKDELTEWINNNLDRYLIITGK